VLNRRGAGYRSLHQALEELRWCVCICKCMCVSVYVCECGVYICPLSTLSADMCCIRQKCNASLSLPLSLTDIHIFPTLDFPVFLLDSHHTNILYQKNKYK